MTLSVTAQDIESEWRPLTPAEAQTLAGKSTAAWTRIVALVPGIEDNIDAGLVSQDTVKSVMASMIVRVLKNPDSVRTVQSSIDDYNGSRTLDNTVSSGELYLTDFEIGLLTPTPGVPSYGMYVIGLGGP